MNCEPNQLPTDECLDKPGIITVDYTVPERDLMLADCYKAGLTPEAAARLVQLVDDLYLNPIVADSFPSKHDYLITMLANQKPPKGIPSQADIEAAKMQLDAQHGERQTKQAMSELQTFPSYEFKPRKPKFSDTIKATIK